MLKISFLHTNTHRETFAPLINCVSDDALLEFKTIPDIDQGLLQFIDVMNVVACCISFIFCSTAGSDLCCWVAKVW